MSNLKQWIEKVKEYKKEIAKLETKDRLQTTASIFTLHGSIAASLNGWAQWLTNPSVMNQLTKEELEETFQVFKKLAEEFLDLDFKMTSSVLKKQKKKKRKKKVRGESYIS